MNALGFAMRYGERGWAVFPMHEPEGAGCSCSRGATCDKPGKHPRTKHGVRDATTDAHQVLSWWTRWPRANVALAAHSYCGPLNFGTGIETDVNELFAHIRTACRSQAPEQHGPAKPGEQKRSVISPKLASQVISWHAQVPLAEGIAKTVDFFRQKLSSAKS